MDWTKLTDEEIAIAKEAMHGPLGQELAKFPMRFAKCVFFAQDPNVNPMSCVNNGTGALVDLGEGPFLLTCSHVLKRYYERALDEADLHLVIGSLRIDPGERVLGDDADLDLAALRLEKEELAVIHSDGPIGEAVFRPSEWPPQPVKSGDSVSFGGFPGILRDRVSAGRLSCGTFSIGASSVVSVGDDHCYVHSNREDWVCALGEDSEENRNFRALPGVSGGPVFVHRKHHFEFIGIVSAYQPEYDVFRVALARRVRPDGTIDRTGLA